MRKSRSGAASGRTGLENGKEPAAVEHSQKGEQETVGFVKGKSLKLSFKNHEKASGHTRY